MARDKVHWECCGLYSLVVNQSSGVGAKTQLAQYCVAGRRQQHVLKEECKNGAKHPLILPCSPLLLWDFLSYKQHVCLVLHFGIFWNFFPP